jgi:hypothetical protein
MLVEDTSRNKCFFQFRISNVLRFISTLCLTNWLSLVLTPFLGKLNRFSDLEDGESKFLRKFFKLIPDYTVSHFRRQYSCRENLRSNFITIIMHANVIKYFIRKIKPKGLVCSSFSGLLIFCDNCFRSWPQILCKFICQQNVTTCPQAADYRRRYPEVESSCKYLR